MSENVSIVTKEQKAVQQRSYCKQGRVERGYCGYYILPGLTAVGVKPTPEISECSVAYRDNRATLRYFFLHHDKTHLR